MTRVGCNVTCLRDDCEATQEERELAAAVAMVRESGYLGF